MPTKPKAKTTPNLAQPGDLPPRIELRLDIEALEDRIDDLADQEAVNADLARRNAAGISAQLGDVNTGIYGITEDVRSLWVMQIVIGIVLAFVIVAVAVIGTGVH